MLDYLKEKHYNALNGGREANISRCPNSEAPHFSVAGEMKSMHDLYVLTGRHAPMHALSQPF